MQILPRQKTTIIKENEFNFLALMVLFLAAYSFLGYLMPKTIQNFLLIVGDAGLLLYTVFNKKLIKILHIRLMVSVALFLLLLLASSTYSYSETSFKLGATISAIFVSGILLSMKGKWFGVGLRYLLFFSLMHSAFTLFQYSFPDIFSSMIYPLLPSEISETANTFLSAGFYSGIADQIGSNAFYISVGIGIISTNVIGKNRKPSLVAIVILSILMLTLLLTGKRGHVLSNILAFIFVIGVYAKVQHKSVATRILFSVVGITLLSLVIVYIVPETATPFLRFISDTGEDITSGRMDLYAFAIMLFLQKPILGWGLGTFSFFQDTGAHNVYLQLLCENGIAGVLSFIVILALNLWVVLTAIKSNCRLDGRPYNRYLFFSLYMQLFFISYCMSGNPLNDGFILVLYVIAMSIPYSITSFNTCSHGTHRPTRRRQHSQNSCA